MLRSSSFGLDYLASPFSTCSEDLDISSGNLFYLSLNMRQCSAVQGALFHEIQKLLELAFGCYTRCNWKTFVGTAVEVSLESVRNPPETRTIGLTQKNPKPKSKRTYYIYKYANKRQCLTRLMRKERRSSWVWVACSYN